MDSSEPSFAEFALPPEWWLGRQGEASCLSVPSSAALRLLMDE